jgi:hypothetical protein
MNRAAMRKTIFNGNADFVTFKGLLKKFTGRTHLVVAAYCIMPNHYHVLVRGSGEGLTHCFHEVDRQWAIRFNAPRDGKGHVFQGPFLSFSQKSVGRLLRTSLYIHLNPVPSLVTRPEEYAWSSYREYLNAGPDSDWIAPSEILPILGPDEKLSRREYAESINVRMGLNTWDGHLPEELALQHAQAAEIASAMPALTTRLGLGEDDAKRMAAFYGRTEMKIGVAVLSKALGFPSEGSLRVQVHRLSVQVSKDLKKHSLLKQAIELLEGP